VNEDKCREITAFMICYGLTTIEKRRVSLDKETPLGLASKHFGRPVKQELIYDENFFRFNDSDLNKPLHKFSNNCNINLLFLFESQMQEFGSKLTVKKK
jgi:hypothetical protein